MSHVRATADHAKFIAVAAEVEQSILRPLLPAALSPRRLYGSTGALFLQFIDVPKSPIGPYRECTLSIMCKPNLDWPADSVTGWSSQPGFPIWVGVTSESASTYGREVWAYPKQVADVRIELQEGWFRGDVSMPGEITVRLSATLPAGLEHGELEFRTLSARGDELLVARMPGRARFSTDWDPQASYRLELPALGLPAIAGVATSGVYAEDYTYELLPPVSKPLSEAMSGRPDGHDPRRIDLVRIDPD